jgi:hypothetical protein
LNRATIGRTHFKAHFDREYLSRRPFQPDGFYGPNFEFIPYRPGCDLTVAFGSGLATLNLGIDTPFDVYSLRNFPGASNPCQFTIPSLIESLGSGLEGSDGHSQPSLVLALCRSWTIFAILWANRDSVPNLVPVEAEGFEQTKADAERFEIPVFAETKSANEDVSSQFCFRKSSLIRITFVEIHRVQPAIRKARSSLDVGLSGHWCMRGSRPPPKGLPRLASG